MKRKPKSTRKKLVAELDRVFSLYIRKRDKNTCVLCGSQSQPNNGHLITRNRAATRYDTLNCNCQCWPCNKLHRYQPQIYTQWFLHNHGQKAYDDLCFRASQPRKWSLDELRMWIEYYRSQLTELP